MFNLFRSRDKAVRLLLSGLLLVVALSMVAYLIPGSSDYSSPASTEAVLAEVGGAEITAREVQHALLGAQRGRELTPSMMRHFVPQLIEQLITERAVEYQATRLGFEVSKQDTANAIQRELPYLFQNGVFVGKEAYAAALAQQNLTIAEFENYMSRQILLNRMRNVVLEAVVVSNVEIEQEFRRRNEKAVVEYVKVEAEKIRPTIQPSMEELKEYFQRNRQGFMMGERRTFTLVILDPAKRGASVTVTDAEVRRAYEENKDRYRIPERVKSRHILLSTAGKPEAEIAKVQAKANDLLKQIKGGTDFAELAKKNSEDTATAPGGGELGWVERGRTVAEFETTLYALKPNEVSNVVKTQYGFHIIQAQGREEARLKPFDEVKAELEGEVKRQKASYGMQAAVDEALGGLRKDPAQAEALGKKLDLQVVKADKLAPTDPVPEIGSNPEYYAVMSVLKKGEVSQPWMAPGNRMIITVMQDILPPRPAEFSEVENACRAGVTAEKTNKQVADKTALLMAKVKEFGGDLQKAAKAAGLTVVKSPEFSRVGAIEGLGSATSIPDLFKKPVGELFGPAPLNLDRVVGRVVARIEPNLGELAAQRDAVREDLKRSRARERSLLLEDGIRRKLESEGKLKVHKEAVQRIIQSYT